ncbi:MAG: LuxR C-terminal-related transcriptional regulator, partial [Rubrobacteraceae bacterium]
PLHRVMLIEDHASFRQTLAFVLNNEPDFEVVAEAASISEARSIIAREGSGIDLAVVDLDLPDGEGTEIIPVLRAANPNFAALVLTASLDREDLARTVEAGAAGILHKSAELDDILTAIRSVASGGRLLSNNEIVEMLRLASRTRERERDARRAANQLTPRELDVLEALANGLSNKQIAERLHISLETERTHIMNIMTKLGAHSRLQALLFCLRYGIVDLD